MAAPKQSSKTSAVVSRRGLIATAAAAAALEAGRRLLFGSTPALAQGAAEANPALLSEQEVAYRNKMTKFVTELYSVPTEQLSKEAAIRRIAIGDAIKGINRDLELRPILMNVDFDYLERLARYGKWKWLHLKHPKE